MAILYNDELVTYSQSTYTYNGSETTALTINGIWGQTFSSGTENLIVVWNNHPVIYSTSGWQHQAVTLTTGTEAFFDSFLDHVFLVNYYDSNYSYNGSTWSTTTNLNNSPIAQYVKEHNTRLYLYKIKIGDTEKPSWCWFSDLPKNGQITWGLENGSDLAQTASSAVVTSASSSFVTKNIKIGDPFVIETGANAGEYVVKTIDSATQITLTASLAENATNSTFWVGGNYFEVSTEDGDIGNGIAETSNELFLFKKNSLFRYNASARELRKVKTAPGTTSARSIVESKSGKIYWYHPSGIYRTEGANGELISNAIEDVINGVTTTNQSLVCGWRNELKKTINMYLGDVTLRDGTTITHCVAIFDENAETWSFGSMDTRVKVATNWLESNTPKVYGGDAVSKVFQLETGYSFNNSAIPFELELHPIYPEGSESVVTFTRLRAYITNGPDVQILYKLIYKPTAREDTWFSDTEWKSLKGTQTSDRNEWYFPSKARASGIVLKAIESSSKESFLLEKLVLYYQDVSNR